MEIWEFDDYVSVIKRKLQDNSDIKGYQTLVARAGGFHASHFSIVLSGKAHLSLEQAIAVCNFWGFDYNTTEYFLTLVSLAKSGTEKLKAHFRARIKELRAQQKGAEDSSLLAVHSLLSQDDSIFLWANWQCAAISAALDLSSKARTVPWIAERLRLPKLLVQSTLSRMQRLELVKELPNEEWGNIGGFFRKAPPSEFSDLFHRSVRQLTGLGAEGSLSELSLHKSAFGSVSRKKAQQMRDKLQELLLFLYSPDKEEQDSDKTDILALNLELLAL